MQTVHRVAQQDAPRQPSRSLACSSVKSVVPSACVCLQELMETSNPALATIIGRQRGEDPNVLEELTNLINSPATSM